MLQTEGANIPRPTFQLLPSPECTPSRRSLYPAEQRPHTDGKLRPTKHALRHCPLGCVANTRPPALTELQQQHHGQCQRFRPAIPRTLGSALARRHSTASRLDDDITFGILACRQGPVCPRPRQDPHICQSVRCLDHFQRLRSPSRLAAFLRNEVYSGRPRSARIQWLVFSIQGGCQQCYKKYCSGGG